MNEEESFLRAICDHPDDDTPRLVFADWLTEQGGPLNTAWANGIRSQVWLAQGVTDAALVAQSRIFESSYGRQKLYKRLGGSDWLLNQWERGFPTCLTGSFFELRDQWPRMAFRLPIRILRIYEVSEASAAEFATWPALSVLKELEFSATWESLNPVNVLPILADCAALQNLKALRVWSALFSEAAVTALLDSPYLTKLSALQLGCNPTTPDLSQALKDRLVTRFGEEVFAAIPF